MAGCTAAPHRSAPPAAPSLPHRCRSSHAGHQDGRGVGGPQVDLPARVGQNVQPQRSRVCAAAAGAGGRRISWAQRAQAPYTTAAALLQPLPLPPTECNGVRHGAGAQQQGLRHRLFGGKLGGDGLAHSDERRGRGECRAGALVQVRGRKYFSSSVVCNIRPCAACPAVGLQQRQRACACAVCACVCRASGCLRGARASALQQRTCHQNFATGQQDRCRMVQPRAHRLRQAAPRAPLACACKQGGAAVGAVACHAVLGRCAHSPAGCLGLSPVAGSKIVGSNAGSLALLHLSVQSYDSPSLNS